jgi:hypothetical protein
MEEEDGQAEMGGRGGGGGGEGEELGNGKSLPPNVTNPAGTFFGTPYRPRTIRLQRSRSLVDILHEHPKMASPS